MTRALLLVAAVMLLACCATGTDAVARGGTFEFVTSGGKTDIFYDPPADRGAVAGLAGDSLTEAGTTVSLQRYRGQVVVLKGIPRSVVPLTIVLDRQHRVAAVFLHAVHAQDLQPIVERISREP